MVTNIHYRDFHASHNEVGAILNSLSSTEDKLWPFERWPAMLIKKPITIGSKGGHSIIKYEVEWYEPGQSIRFRFRKPIGFIGTHEFSVTKVSPEITRLQHTIKMSLKGAAKIQWIFAIRWLHDSLIEDALDKAESHLNGQKWKPRKLPLWTKLLRIIIGIKLK